MPHPDVSQIHMVGLLQVDGIVADIVHDVVDAGPQIVKAAGFIRDGAQVQLHVNDAQILDDAVWMADHEHAGLGYRAYVLERHARYGTQLPSCALSIRQQLMLFGLDGIGHMSQQWGQAHAARTSGIVV